MRVPLVVGVRQNGLREIIARREIDAHAGGGEHLMHPWAVDDRRLSELLAVVD